MKSKLLFNVFSLFIFACSTYAQSPAVWTPVSGNSDPWSGNPNYAFLQAYLYLPKGYNDAGNSRNYPLIIFLHGNGVACDSTRPGFDITKLLIEGLPKAINDGSTVLDSCVVICPQGYVNVGDWNQPYTPERIRRWVVDRYRIDTPRVYLTGLSGGAQGAIFSMRNADSDLFAAALAVSGGVEAGSYEPNFKSYPAMFVGGDINDNIQPYWKSSTSSNSTASHLLNNINNSATKNIIPVTSFLVKGGGHGGSVWDNRVYKKSSAYFDFEKWFLLFSRNKTYTATKHVELLENYISAFNYSDALFVLDNVQTYINALSSGTTKTSLQARFDNAKNLIDSQGKRYVLKFGKTFSNSGFNYLLTGTTGSTVSNLVDNNNTSSSKSFTIVTQATTGNTVRTYSASSRYYFEHKYLGFPSGFLSNSFVVNQNGGQYKFTGLENNRKYQLVVFGAVDTISKETKSLTVIAGDTAQYIFTPFNTSDYISFKNISPEAGEISFAVKGEGTIINPSSVVRTHGATMQTPVSNISGYNDSTSYISGAMLIEGPIIEPGSVIDTLTPIADAYVRDGTYDTTNYGLDTSLMVKKDGTNLSRDTYLKFIVPHNGAIANAKLQLYNNTSGSTANTTQWQLWQVNDTTWTEGGITWNNKPAKNTLLATVNGGTLSGYYTWDATAALQNLPAGSISLAIVSTVSGSATQATFASREKSTVEKRPKLILSYSSQNYGSNADSYVRGGPNNNDNYGSLTTATVKYDASQSYTRYAYFKFVIPAKSRQAAANAKLKLYSVTPGPTANTAKWVLYSAGSNWTESGITWANQPTPPGTAIDSVNGSSTAGFFNWNITNYINNLTSDTVSLVLKCSYTDSTSSQANFSTKEATAAANRPQIILDFADTSSGARIISAPNFVALSEKSITKPELPATVFVYPNPLRNSCLIQSKKTIKAITLFDAAGRPVKTVTSVNAKQYRLSIPGVAKGIYFLVVKGDGFSDKKTLNIQ